MRVENKLLKKSYCCDCGREIDKKSTRCKECHIKNKVLEHQKELPITRKELKELIRTKSFLEIGRIYNITDNGIRRWCDSFKLPRTKREINSYSNEE